MLVTEDGELTEGLASVPQLDRDGKFVLCGGGRSIIFDENMEVLAVAPLGEDMSYRFDVEDLTREEKALAVCAKGEDEESTQERARLGSAKPPEDLNLWHKRLGHRNKRDLGYAISHGLLTWPPPSAAKNKKREQYKFTPSS